MITSPPVGTAFAPIVLADRNGADESLHHGAAVAIDPDGGVVAVAGDRAVRIYPRSALKPFQAAAMVAHGLDLSDRLLALVASSHSGEPMHLDGVREILGLHGLTTDDLANTPSRPFGAAARAAARLAGAPPSSVQQNCSGKHAAMLATCRINDWPTEGYLRDDHPLQKAIIVTIEELGATVEHTGVDGCGAPTHVLELAATARAIGRLAASGSVVTTAMAEHPEMVGGTDRDVTIWMDAVTGLVAKDGAQGVMAMAMPDGRAVAFKIADGSDLARRTVTIEALRHLGIDVDGEHRAARDRVAVPVLGHGRPVGMMRALPWGLTATSSP